MIRYIVYVFKGIDINLKNDKNSNVDKFAQIASQGIGGRAGHLQDNVPIPFKKKVCFLKDGVYKAVPTKDKISTKEELYTELEEIHEKYHPFLTDLAPFVPSLRERIDLKSFDINGKPITLPHYGFPVGNGKQTYETSFSYEKSVINKSIFLCFEGADYITTVYVNGFCVGQHEGFFSPFEFDITDVLVSGLNHIKIELYNDYIYMGNGIQNAGSIEGDKLYAATGLGWDDPSDGWHHCPAGMGIYGSVYVEIRNCIHFTDLFVRPMETGAEVWAEITNSGYKSTDIEICIDIYGQNFEENTVLKYVYKPKTVRFIGLGDSLTEAKLGDKVTGEIPMSLMHGKNLYKIFIRIENARKWDLETPWLYQVQARVLINGTEVDNAKQQFGMRCFTQDTNTSPKGMFYLNGRKIRLRGANTMGFEQQDILCGDIDQLIDDILLAKLCNMNFWRLTQRPVQKEVYDYCDKLGLMTQTDLPLFGCMRRTKFAEGVRQAEEMERIVRSHPCNIIISYINEPFPNANNEPHRHFTRDELMNFFRACDSIVRLNNPDRVIKYVDGDYDPPSDNFPDNHCYTMWYNGHGIDIGKLHKGYWMPTMPGWFYGCGEYGSEGLDFPDLMYRRYPAEWLSEPFDPNNIPGAQSGNFHYFFYDTQDTVEDWSRESQAHQSFSTRLMTEAFRRDPRMVSSAIHLFIDAWPSGWMKAIMDCERNPKPAFFAYRNALEPLMLSLRTDRFTFTTGELISIEVYLCNDTAEPFNGSVLFELYRKNGSLLKCGECPVIIMACDTVYTCNVEFSIGEVDDRESFILKSLLLKKNSKTITYNEIEIEVFSDVKVFPKSGNVVLFEKLTPGEYEIAGEKVRVKACSMLPVHFASRKTNHHTVFEFRSNDFSYWYNNDEDQIVPLCNTTFEAAGFTPILTGGNINEKGEWRSSLIAAEKIYQGKRFIICQIDLRMENPIAKRFFKKLTIDYEGNNI